MVEASRTIVRDYSGPERRRRPTWGYVGKPGQRVRRACSLALHHEEEKHDLTRDYDEGQYQNHPNRRQTHYKIEYIHSVFPLAR